MTSNLANEEIAAHALQLRREAKTAAHKYRQSETNGETGEKFVTMCQS